MYFVLKQKNRSSVLSITNFPERILMIFVTCYYNMRLGFDDFPQLFFNT